ncbi:hypothetical protein [Nonomuraea jiangxiensis]|uniref:Uncharacterized protein n=1 Tax=Nonomuraea jiangxiensis TaxID=633440 RepID=A0A1G8H3E9_9ACTN|nr:hypothetical protein [Nonomuraea jiangxiensis]SDI01081.1 hypothetical protein SAMN05421869_10440 [Nonomuraea jiangxiensis]
MSIKEAAMEFGTKIENEHIQIRADIRELGEVLTHRINAVDNRVKELDAKVEARFTMMDLKITDLQQGQQRLQEQVYALQEGQKGLQEQVHTLQEGQKSLHEGQKGLVVGQTEILKVLVAIQRKLDVN